MRRFSLCPVPLFPASVFPVLLFLVGALLCPAGAPVAQQTPAAPSSGPAPEAAARPPSSAPAMVSRVLGANTASTVLGREVFDIDGDNVGLLVDVLVDGKGVPLAGVIEVGGFLGVGSRRVAVAWRLLRPVAQDGNVRLTMDVTHDMAAAAPEYRGPDNTYVVFDRPGP